MLQVYLSGRSIELAGVTMSVAEPTVREYRVKVRGVFDPRLYRADQVADLIRAELYTFIAANTRVGWTVYESALRDSAFVPEVRDVRVNFVLPTNGNTFAPDDDGADHAGNLAAADGFTRADIFTCLQDEDNVIITMAEL